MTVSNSSSLHNLTTNKAFLAEFQKLADGGITDKEVPKLQKLAEKHGISMEKLVEAAKDRFDTKGLEAATKLIKPETAELNKTVEGYKPPKVDQKEVKNQLGGLLQMFENLTNMLKTLQGELGKIKASYGENKTDETKGSKTGEPSNFPDFSALMKKIEDTMNSLLKGKDEGKSAYQSFKDGLSSIGKQIGDEINKMKGWLGGEPSTKKPDSSAHDKPATILPYPGPHADNKTTTPDTKTTIVPSHNTTTSPETNQGSGVKPLDFSATSPKSFNEAMSPFISEKFSNLQKAEENFRKNPNDPNAKIAMQKAMHELEELVNLVSTMMKKFHEMTMAIIRNM